MLAEASEVIGATVSLVNPVVGAMLLVGGKALSFFAQNTKGGRGDIWKAKDELSKALRKLDKPILILIDDLDRLHKTEIRSMLTAIRAVGNLPNVIYVLAYDRAIVTDALESDGTNGHKFLEKIIQVKISVPLLNELDTYNYILDDITSRHIVSVDEVDGYKNVLIFIIDSIPTMRLANQLLNRFHYRYLYQMGQLCTFDLFLLSIIEVLAPPIIDLIISNPPTDEPEVPISWRLLSSKQRKQSFAHDLMKHFGSINEGLKKPVQPPNEVSQQNHFESKIYDVSARALREFRAITFISKILFDLDEITAFDDGLTGRPDFETGNYKHRLKEHIYFPYYFMYANERGCTPQQFESYMNLLRQGQRAFNQDEESSFRTLFINKCSYEFVASDIDVYITLLVQLTSDLTNKELPQTFDAIRNLIYNCIKYENDAIKVFDALINDNTKVLYLVFLYNLTTEEFSSSMQFRMASIAAMYKLKLEHQIAKNVTAQSKELPKSLYTGDVIEFLFTHRDNTNIQSALDKMISDDTLYNSYIITQLRKNKDGQYEVLSADRLPFFNREELAKDFRS